MFNIALARISELSQPAQVTGWLSESLLTQAPLGKRRAAWLAGRALLAQHTKQQPLAEIHISQQGKPTFIDPCLPAFNISHSADFILVATAVQGAIGCDLEVIRQRPACFDIAESYFSRGEYLWLKAQPESNRAAAFWRLWTVREAILKQRGASIWQMHELVLDPENLDLPSLDISAWQQDGLSLAVVVNR